MQDLVVQLVENTQQIGVIEKQISERIADFQNKLVSAKERDQELRNAVKQAMETTNTPGYEDENIKITYIKAAKRSGVDLDKLRTFHPNIAKECEKITDVKSQIRLKIK